MLGPCQSPGAAAWVWGWPLPICKCQLPGAVPVSLQFGVLLAAACQDLEAGA